MLWAVGILLGGWLWFPVLHWIGNANPLPLRLFYDAGDLAVYYRTTQWVLGEGQLYRDAFSEYPFLANIVFGLIRWLSLNLKILPPAQSFVFFWTYAVLLLLFLIIFLQHKWDRSFWWIWLTPPFLYFGLYRYDIYPVFCCFLGLRFIAEEKYGKGGFWLGLCIALKGYALFILPVLAYYVWKRRSLSTAWRVVAIAMAPLALTNGFVWLSMGYEALIMPYQFHMEREFNGESTVDAVVYLMHWAGVSEQKAALLQEKLLVHKWIIGATTAFGALAGLLLRPRTFEEFLRAAFFVVIGFVSVTSFYSPQFVLWFAAFTCFTQSRTIRIWLVIYTLITFLYFPIFHDLMGKPSLSFKISISILALMRLGFLVAIIFRLSGSRLYALLLRFLTVNRKSLNFEPE